MYNVHLPTVQCTIYIYNDGASSCDLARGHGITNLSGGELFATLTLDSFWQKLNYTYLGLTNLKKEYLSEILYSEKDTAFFNQKYQFRFRFFQWFTQSNWG